MLIPAMGLLMVGIPLAGFVAGVVLLCFKQTKFLSPFAFFMPASTSYGAIVGFWSSAVGLETIGLSEFAAGLGGLLGAVLLGSIGAWLAFRYAAKRKLRNGALP